MQGTANVQQNQQQGARSQGVTPSQTLRNSLDALNTLGKQNAVKGNSVDIYA
jgi:hypothetical protein